MERGFDIRTGSVTIGDPAMGLVTYGLRLPPGRYRCAPGALRRPTANDAQTICLDGPHLFVVDTAFSNKFLDWYKQTFNECGFVVPKVAMRLDEAATAIGVQVGFYWEETLSGHAQEGTYALETSLIIKCN